MPIATRIDPTRNVRVHEVSGVLVFDELREMLTSLYDSPDFEPDRNALWDLREAELTGFTADEVRRIVELVGTRWGGGGVARAALVVSRTADFGMARMYELQLTAQPEGRIQVFRDIDQAWSWLLGNAEP
jgi:hypothetical protein